MIVYEHLSEFGHSCLVSSPFFHYASYPNFDKLSHAHMLTGCFFLIGLDVLDVYIGNLRL